MANDLGGKAKVLYSLDDGVSGGGIRPVDLLAADSVESVNYSGLGARIWITSQGKVAYDITSVDPAKFEGAPAGSFIEDSFTYAIRLANGTLS
jgi:hypothetical protein